MNCKTSSKVCSNQKTALKGGFFKNKNDYITVNEVAEILSEEICDKPCNFSNVNEWLPHICNHKNNKDNCNCSNLECWKQYFKHSKRANEFWDKFFKINQEPGKMTKNEIYL